VSGICVYSTLDSLHMLRTSLISRALPMFQLRINIVIRHSVSF